MTLPGYPWPYIFFSLCLTGFLAIMATVKMIGSHSEGKIKEIKDEIKRIKVLYSKETGGNMMPPERKLKEISHIEEAKNLFNRDITVLVYSLLLLLSLTVMHIYSYVALNYIQWFNYVLTFINALICLSILSVAFFLCKIYFSIRPLLTYDSVSAANNGTVNIGRNKKR